MNLILQSLTSDRAAIEPLIELVRPQRVSHIGLHAWCCEHVLHHHELIAQLDAACLAAQFDYALIEAGRSLTDFKLLAIDMDSTLINIECIDEIADMHGLKPQVAAITSAAMNGTIAFRESLTQRVALLKGLELAALERVYDERLSLSPGAEKMLSAMQAAGLKTVLISGGFTFFSDRLRQQLKLDDAHANVLEVMDGKLTGHLLGNLIDATEKRAILERICEQFGLSAGQTIVIGDGANDLDMMRISGLSVAFRAKPIVRQKAHIALNFVGLDGILNVLS